LGSDRTYEQYKELMGDQDTTSYEIKDGKLLYGGKNQEGNYNKEFEMRRHIDYKKENMPDQIKNFIALKGYSEDDYVG
jgi:hypothetical protein